MEPANAAEGNGTGQDGEGGIVTNALIIAAGKGSRMAGRSNLKPLVSVLGVPLIERVIVAGVTAGVRRFWVVTGYRRELLQPVLEELSQRLGVTISELHNSDWKKSNGVSVLAAQAHIAKPFILMMSDHLFDPQIIRFLCRDSLDGVDVRLAVDFDTSSRDIIDLDDVTKVRLEGDRIVEIGKDLEQFDCYDTGIFLCTQGIFDALGTVFESKGNASLSEGIRALGARRRAAACDIGDLFWMDVDNGAMLDQAERLITAAN